KNQHVDMVFGTHNIHRLPYILKDAMLTTLYGSVLANMIAIPLAEKVYRGIEDLYTEKKFVIEAISELYRGQIPSKLKLKLDTYVYETKVKKVKGAA
ncbi:hypothetical protein ACT4US_26620, partial [Bacillus sp. HC-Mk]